jgi:hypothetical protein
MKTKLVNSPAIKNKNNIVIYTSIFGKYAGPLPQPKYEGIDYICFTNKVVKAKPWKVKMAEPKFKDPVRCAKIFKILPHLFLSEYKYSIWIDCNFLVKKNIQEFVYFALKKNNMAIFDHKKTKGDARDCIYDELEAIKKLGKKTGIFKDNIEVMEKQINRYKNEGYPANNGLIKGGILIRKHNESDVINAMNLWWKEIKFGSRRDQLSFNYVA